ncbi:phosphopantetheine-binding protein, partial [Corynebacterium macclintockiae]|uniref:phosphopantetheine-binding protein n=1 Tax=Corynebacterium macclintockiae TaxID=2913501 RepID=UPI00254A00B6
SRDFGYTDHSSIASPRCVHFPGVGPIRREMSVEISIRDVFNHPTVRELSDLIADIVGSDVEEGEI